MKAPDGYKVKLCSTCYRMIHSHEDRGDYCRKCWNLSGIGADYWLSESTTTVFQVSKPPTESDIINARLEHLEYMLSTILERLDFL